MTWQQYSIPGNFPIEAVKKLPDYGERWHFLFEPQLLVRVERDMDIPHWRTSLDLPANAKWGDAARSSPSGDNGRLFHGEQEFYGKELWEANADFLHASSNLIKTLLKQKRNVFPMQRKHVHLLCNQFGMNRWQEMVFYIRCAVRAFYLASRGR